MLMKLTIEFSSRNSILRINKPMLINFGLLQAGAQFTQHLVLLSIWVHNHPPIRTLFAAASLASKTLSAQLHLQWLAGHS